MLTRGKVVGYKNEPAVVLRNDAGTLYLACSSFDEPVIVDSACPTLNKSAYSNQHYSKYPKLAMILQNHSI